MDVIIQWFKKTFSDPQVVMLTLLVLALVIAISFFGSMLAPVIAAIVFAFLLDGPVVWLEKRGMGHLLSVTLVFTIFVAISLVILIAVVPLLIGQIGSFFREVPSMVTSLQQELNNFQARFPEFVTPEQVKDWIASIGNEAASLGPSILVPVMVFFFLKDKAAVFAFMKTFVPSHRGLSEKVWREAVAKAGDYARGKVYEIIIVGTVAFLVFTFIEIRYATLLAVLTGFSVIIPYVGATVVTIPVALVALIQWGVGPDFAIAVGAYLVLQAFDGNLLAPLLFSEVVKLHPNAIILAILVFGGFWGLWGVFFAIPLATMANAIIRAMREHVSEAVNAGSSDDA